MARIANVYDEQMNQSAIQPDGWVVICRRKINDIPVQYSDILRIADDNPLPDEDSFVYTKSFSQEHLEISIDDSGIDASGTGGQILAK